MKNAKHYKPTNRAWKSKKQWVYGTGLAVVVLSNALAPATALAETNGEVKTEQVATTTETSQPVVTPTSSQEVEKTVEESKVEPAQEEVTTTETSQAIEESTTEDVKNTTAEEVKNTTTEESKVVTENTEVKTNEQVATTETTNSTTELTDESNTKESSSSDEKNDLSKNTENKSSEITEKADKSEDSKPTYEEGRIKYWTDGDGNIIKRITADGRVWENFEKTLEDGTKISGTPWEINEVRPDGSSKTTTDDQSREWSAEGRITFRNADEDIMSIWYIDKKEFITLNYIILNSDGSTKQVITEKIINSWGEDTGITGGKDFIIDIYDTQGKLVKRYWTLADHWADRNDSEEVDKQFTDFEKRYNVKYQKQVFNFDMNNAKFDDDLNIYNYYVVNDSKPTDPNSGNSGDEDTKPTDPNNGNSGDQGKGDEGTKPTDPNSGNSADQGKGDEGTKPTDPNNGNPGDQGKTDESTKPTTPESKTDTPKKDESKVNNTKDETNSKAAAKSNNTKELPKTGENSFITSVLVAIGLTSIAGATFLNRKKNK